MSSFELPSELRLLLKNELLRRDWLAAATKVAGDLRSAATCAGFAAVTLTFAANIVGSIVGDGTPPLVE